jgi:hypothetical protein
MNKHAPTAEQVATLYGLASTASRTDIQKTTDTALEFIYTLEQNIQAGGPSSEWLGWFHRESEDVIEQLDTAIHALNTLRQSLHVFKVYTPPGKPQVRNLDIEKQED